MKVWRKVRLGDLLKESRVVSESPDPDKRIRVKLNVLGVEKRPNINEKEGATKYYKRKKGQFIYGKQNLHKRAFGIIPDELDGFESSSDIPAFDIDDSCYPEWIFYFFFKDNFYLSLAPLAKGVGAKRIQPKQVFDLYIYLPEKAEQKKIIDLIKIIEKKYEAVINESILQEKHITKLRQSVLQNAVLGELTKDWRNKHSGIGSAKDLLKQIHESKKDLISKKKIKKEKIASISSEEIPYEIPEEWEWCRIIDIT